MSLLIALILCFLVSGSCEQEETNPETLGERVKTNLDSNPTTINILEGIYSRPLTPQFKGFLHLSLNNLLVSTEILASTSPDDSPGLKQLLILSRRKI